MYYWPNFKVKFYQENHVIENWFVRLSDTVSSEVRDKYGAKVKLVYGIEVSPEYSRENIKKMGVFEGETVVRSGTHLAFSPNAHKTAYISVRTADELIA